jgi:hypothetical protein
MKQLTLGLAVSTLLLGAIAQPAMAGATNPAVIVHADSGLVQVSGTTVPLADSTGAKVGDLITVTQGSAIVTYDNGCSVTVTGQYRIPAVAPVCTGVFPMAHDGKFVAIGLGAIALVGIAAGSGGGGGKSSSP